MFVSSYNFVCFLLFCLNACFPKYCFSFFPLCVLIDMLIILQTLKHLVQYPVKSLSNDDKFLKSTFITYCFLSQSLITDSFLDLVVWVRGCGLKIHPILKYITQALCLFKFLLRCVLLFCFS